MQSRGLVICADCFEKMPSILDDLYQKRIHPTKAELLTIKEELIQQLKTLNYNQDTNTLNLKTKQQMAASLSCWILVLLPQQHVKMGIIRPYVVFWFDIFKTRGKGLTELQYFEYLNIKNLWEKQTTYFFCDIAQYREWKFEQGMKYDSWNAYRCTCFKFFSMYSHKVLNKKNYEAVGKRAYETIDMDVFDEFIQKCKRKEKFK